MNSKSNKTVVVWGLDYNKLIPGDIILTRHSSIKSRGIRVGAKGKLSERYSHASIFIGGGSVAESNQEGVYFVHPIRIAEENRSDILVLRPTEKLTKESLLIIEKWLRSLVGNPYSIKGALRAGFYQTFGHELNQSEDDGQFCSRLVAEAFHQAGLNIFEKSHLQTPSSLVQGNVDKLEHLTVEHKLYFSVGEIEDADISKIYANNLLDAYRQEIGKEFSGIIKNFWDVDGFIWKNPGHDDSFSDILMNSDYYNNVCEIQKGSTPGVLLAALLEKNEEVGVDLVVDTIHSEYRDPDHTYMVYILNQYSYSCSSKTSQAKKYCESQISLNSKIIANHRYKARESIAYFVECLGRFEAERCFPGMLVLDDFFPELLQDIERHYNIEAGNFDSFIDCVNYLLSTKSAALINSISEYFRDIRLVDRIDSISNPRQIAIGVGKPFTNHTHCNSLSHEHLSSIIHYDTYGSRVFLELANAFKKVRNSFFVEYSKNIVSRDFAMGLLKSDGLKL